MSDANRDIVDIDGLTPEEAKKIWTPKMDNADRLGYIRIQDGRWRVTDKGAYNLRKFNKPRLAALKELRRTEATRRERQELGWGNW
jgi:hypothetical protein